MGGTMSLMKSAKRILFSRFYNAIASVNAEKTALVSELEAEQRKTKTLQTVVDSYKDRISLYSQMFAAEQELNSMVVTTRLAMDLLDILKDDQLRCDVAARALERDIQANPNIRKGLDQVLAFQETCAPGKPPMIVTGFAKSGNTLLRFMYMNMIAILNADATETVSYYRLNEINRTVDFYQAMQEGIFRPPINFDHSGFPILLHSHVPWTPSWSAIGSVVFLYRNPLDTLISYWYNNIEFSETFHGKVELDAYVQSNIGQWAVSYLRGITGADHILCYEDLMRQPAQTMAALLRDLEIDVSDDVVERAAAMSSFESIRKMEDATSQHQGHRVYNPNIHEATHPEQWREGARFTRSGAIGQWKEALKPETIEKVRQTLEKYDIPKNSMIWE